MIINLKSQTEFAGFYIVFEGTTNIEDKGTRGISHLIEHLICKTFQDLRNDFQKEGIDWNASTTNNLMVFYFTGLEKKLKPFRNRIIDRIFDFDISKKDFETERKIILEEYSDTINKQTKKHLLNVYRKYLNNFAPIGFKTDLEQLRFIDVLNFYEKNYNNPTKIINVFKSSKFESNVIDFNETREYKDYTLAEYKNELIENTGKQDKTSVIFMLDLQKDEVDKIKIIAKLLGHGLESPLYKEVREKNALCYSIRSDIDRFNQQALFKIQTLTQKGQEDKVKEVITKVIKNPTKYITKERFEIIKNNLLVQKEKDEINRYQNVQDLLNPEKFSIYREINKVNLKKIFEIYEEKFDIKNFTIDTD